MARFLLGTIPATGHVTPLLPIAHELVQRGHEVWWYSGKAFQSKIEHTGARFVAIATATDYSDPSVIPGSPLAQRDTYQGLAQLKFDLKHFFINEAEGCVQDYLQILREFTADVLVADSFFLAASWVHALIGIPWAEVNTTVLTTSSIDTAPFGLGILPNSSWLGRLRNLSLNWLVQAGIFQEITAHTNQVRRRLGLPPTSVSFFDQTSPYLSLVCTVPSFEYPRSDLGPQVHFIGPLLPPAKEDFTPPGWWDDLQTQQPVVTVTQGTIATDPEDLILPAIEALADSDLLVVVTTGGSSVPQQLQTFSLPRNVRLEPFIPYTHLLPEVDVLVTNGGYGGVQAALAHGIPLVVAGQSEDKREVSARIDWSGLGINLRTQQPTPQQLKQAVTQVLDTPAYRQRAAQIQAEIQQYQPRAIAADLLERLAQTRQPVYADRTRH
jgi:MGT family glycosyltransferase